MFRASAENLKKALSAASEEKKKALKLLEEKMDKKREDAVLKARQEEQRIASDQLADLKNLYEQRIYQMNEVIKTKKKEIEHLYNDCKLTEARKLKAEKELLDLTGEFQKFINSSSGYQEGQADYLICLDQK